MSRQARNLWQVWPGLIYRHSPGTFIKQLDDKGELTKTHNLARDLYAAEQSLSADEGKVKRKWAAVPLKIRQTLCQIWVKSMPWPKRLVTDLIKIVAISIYRPQAEVIIFISCFRLYSFVVVKTGRVQVYFHYLSMSGSLLYGLASGWKQSVQIYFPLKKRITKVYAKWFTRKSQFSTKVWFLGFQAKGGVRIEVDEVRGEKKHVYIASRKQLRVLIFQMKGRHHRDFKENSKAWTLWPRARLSSNSFLLLVRKLRNKNRK